MTNPNDRPESSEPAPVQPGAEPARPRGTGRQETLGGTVNELLSSATDGQVTDLNTGTQSMFKSLGDILDLFLKAIFRPEEYHKKAQAMGMKPVDFGGDEMLYRARLARGETTVEEPEIDPEGTAPPDNEAPADPDPSLDILIELSEAPADRLESGALARIDPDGVRVSPALDAASAELNRQFAAASAMPADPQPTAEITYNFSGPRVA